MAFNPREPQLGQDTEVVAADRSGLERLKNEVRPEELRQLAQDVKAKTADVLRGTIEFMKTPEGKTVALTGAALFLISSLVKSETADEPDEGRKDKPKAAPAQEPVTRAPEKTAPKPEKKKPETLLALAQVRSAPAQRSKQSLITLCSKTARKNLGRYGCINIPMGDADDVKRQYLNLEKEKKIALYRGKPEEIGRTLDESGKRFADLLVKSSGPIGERYGHRAMAVKSTDDGKWYVLDPYIFWRNEKGEEVKGQDPIPLEKYPRKIEFAVALDSKKYPLETATV